jgi:endo-1,4-beta-xylanase
MLMRVLNQDVDAGDAQLFDDVPSDTGYFAYKKKASELGIVKGTGENKFSPDEPITRQTWR